VVNLDFTPRPGITEPGDQRRNRVDDKIVQALPLPLGQQESIEAGQVELFQQIQRLPGRCRFRLRIVGADRHQSQLLQLFQRLANYLPGAITGVLQTLDQAQLGNLLARIAGHPVATGQGGRKAVT